MRSTQLLISLVAVLVLGWLSPAVARAQPIEGAGSLIIVGGAWASDNAVIWEAIEAGRLPGKPLGVFGTASASPSSSGQSFVNSYTSRFGAGTAIYLDVTQDNGQADSPAMASLARTCGGFYFTGGVQTRVTSAMYRPNGARSVVLDAVWDVYLDGGCVAGSSAGAAIMADPMITGGSSAAALSNRSASLGRGLGFFPGSQFDQHHLARGRMGRLLFATLTAGFDRGYGIDENTALVIDNNTGWGEVIGEMGIYVVDVSGLVEGDDGESCWGIRLHYLDFDDRIHMVTGEVIAGGTKELIERPNLDAQTITSNDIWGGYEVWRLVTEMVDRLDTDEARGRDPQFDVLFRMIPETRAWRGPLHTYRNNRRAYMVMDVEVGIFPRGGTFPEPAPFPSGFAIF